MVSNNLELTNAVDQAFSDHSCSPGATVDRRPSLVPSQDSAIAFNTLLQPDSKGLTQANTPPEASIPDTIEQDPDADEGDDTEAFRTPQRL